jgi:hypothetical protein
MKVARCAPSKPIKQVDPGVKVRFEFARYCVAVNQYNCTFAIAIRAPNRARCAGARRRPNFFRSLVASSPLTPVSP